MAPARNRSAVNIFCDCILFCFAFLICFDVILLRIESVAAKLVTVQMSCCIYSEVICHIFIKYSPYFRGKFEILVRCVFLCFVLLV
jgi:hypothetical protein